MRQFTEQEEKEYKEMSATFLDYLKKAYEEGKAKGWTEQEIRAENPILFGAVDEINRISQIPEEELIPVGMCVYCNEPVFKDESFVNKTILLHTDCKKDVWAEIQDQRGQY